MRLLTPVLALVVLVAGASSARAATRTWAAASNGASWNATSSWSGSAVPTSTDDVVFNNSKNTTGVIDSDVKIATLTINGYTGSIAQDASARTVEVTGAFSQSSGTWTSPSYLIVGGVFTYSAGTFTPGTGTVILRSATSRSHAFGSVGFYKLVVTDGMLGYWRFGSSTATFTDSSGFGWTMTGFGTLTANTTNLPPTVFSNSYSLELADGSGGYYGSHPTILKPTTWSMAAWVRIAATDTQGSEVITFGDDFLLRVLTDGNIRAYSRGSTPSTCDTTGISILGTAFHHLAATNDGSTLKVFVDGELTKSCTVTSGGQTFGTGDGKDDVMIGGHPSDPDYEFLGQLDEVKAYDRALSTAEVEALAIGGQPATGVATHTASQAFSTTNDLVLNSGTFAFGSNNISVGGSWWNQGMAVTGTGTVTFTASSSTKGLRANGQRFNAITYATSGATYAMQDPLYVNTLTLSNGTIDSNTYSIYANTINQTGGAFTLSSTANVIMDTATTGTLTMSTTPTNLRVEDPTETNLVGYWKFDQFSGNTSPDSSGNGNTATITNGAVLSTTVAPLSTAGIFNRHSMYLDGDASASTADLISMGVTNMPASNAAQTICFWTRFPSHASTMNFVSLRADAADDGIQIGIDGSDDSIRAWKPGAVALVTNGGAAITNDAWHHICYSYDGSLTHRLYIDNGTAYTGTTAPDAVTPDQVLLGGYDTTTTQRFNGYIDEVRIYNVKLSDAEIASLYAGRYPGRGGFGTTTLGSAVTATTTLVVDAGTLATSSSALSLSATGAAGLVDAGGLTINGGSGTFSGGLTVRGPGTLTMDTTGGTLNLATGKTLTIDGTLTTTTGTATTKPTIKSVSGTYNFYVGSATTATPTLNVNGLIVKNTTTHGLYINQANGATTTTVNQFDNVDFLSGTAAGSHLKIYAQQGIFHFNNLTFDSDVASMTTAYAVHLTGNGGVTTATETRALVAGTCTNAAAACESTYERDDDATEDGLGDTTGSDGAVVQWIYRDWGSVSGAIEGFPSAAFDWSNFTFWRTYVAYNNINGTSTDRLYVRNQHGDALYYKDLTNSENFIGTPRWTVEGGLHYVYAVTTAGRVYKWLDDGSSLTETWVYKQTNDSSASTATSPLALNSTALYWAGNDASSVRSLWRRTYAGDSTTISGLAADISTVPALTSSYVFFAADGNVYRRDTSLGGSTSFAVPSGLIDGRVTLNLDSLVYFIENNGTLWALYQGTFLEAWHYQDTLSSGHTCTNDSPCSAKNLYFDFGTQRIYYGDKDGHVYAVDATSGAKITGYPLQPGASTDTIVTAPLYRGGLIIVGTTTGKVFVINAIDGNSSNNPTLYKTYILGTSSSISSVSFDGNANASGVPTGAYMIGTSDGRLFYLPALSDPG